MKNSLKFHGLILEYWNSYDQVPNKTIEHFFVSLKLKKFEHHKNVMLQLFLEFEE